MDLFIECERKCPYLRFRKGAVIIIDISSFVFCVSAIQDSDFRDIEEAIPLAIDCLQMQTFVLAILKEKKSVIMILMPLRGIKNDPIPSIHE